MDCLDRLLTEVAACCGELSQDLTRKRRTEAPEFNVFDFLRNDEYGLSSVMTWMLDPEETHGQGGLFLRHFLSTFRVPAKLSAQPVRVTMEAATHLIDASSRRIDIHVRLGGYVLAIENKPWAKWQVDQVRDYLRQIEAEATEGHCLVVVRGYGDTVPEGQLHPHERQDLEQRGQLVDGDYTLLEIWVRTCMQECEAPRVRMLLTEFADMIATSFGAVKMTTADQELAQRILDGDNVSAALRLMSATDAVLALLAERCYLRISELACDRLTVEAVRPDPLTRHTGYSFDLDAAAPFTFCVEFDDVRLSSPYFGLKLRVGSNVRHPFPAIKTGLESHGIEAGKSDWYWIWWQVAGRVGFGLSGESAVATWQTLSDGSFAELAMNLALRFDTALRAAGVLPWIPSKFADA